MVRWIRVVATLCVACMTICTVACGSDPEPDAVEPGQAGSEPRPETNTAPAAGSPGGETWDNPFDYCEAVVTIDNPDARYTGDPQPNEILEPMGRRATSPETRPLEWRCLEGAVVACEPARSVPCRGKADKSREVKPEMTSYCVENPGQPFMPANLTGTTTLYRWRCEGKTPTAGEVMVTVDPRGYIANYWKKIPRS